MFQVNRSFPNIQADVLFEVFGFGFTNSMTTGLITVLILFIFSFYIRHKVNISTKTGKVSKIQIVMEMFVEAILNFITTITGSLTLSKSIFGVIASLFLIIGFSNVITLLPPFESIEYNGIALFRTYTSDFNVTFAMAFMVVFISHAMIVKKVGVFEYINKFVPVLTVYRGFKKGIGSGFSSILDFVLGLLDIISEIAKAFSLSLRLFGNIFAGGILMGVFYGLFALLLPGIWTGMSIFSGVIQAIVFGALSASYFTAAVSDD